jgi:hypothetical protein
MAKCTVFYRRDGKFHATVVEADRAVKTANALCEQGCHDIYWIDGEQSD